MPSRISGCPRRAFSLAMRKSHASASSQPPPRAKPEMAAMVARGMSATALSARRNSCPICSASARVMTSVGASADRNSEISAPAAKIRSPPVTTTAPGGSVAQALGRRRRAARSSSFDSAFTLGLSRRTTATPSVAPLDEHERRRHGRGRYSRSPAAARRPTTGRRARAATSAASVVELGSAGGLGPLVEQRGDDAHELVAAPAPPAGARARPWR